jgi:hypothetical protein
LVVTEKTPHMQFQPHCPPCPGANLRGIRV